MKLLKRFIPGFLAVFLAVFCGCATANGFRALDKDEMEMKPVCEIRLKRFNPTAESVAMGYKGRTVYFCCADCVEKFKKYTGRHDKEGKSGGGYKGHNGGGGDGFGSGGGHHH